jgi:hypothetical protein
MGTAEQVSVLNFFEHACVLPAKIKTDKKKETIITLTKLLWADAVFCKAERNTERWYPTAHQQNLTKMERWYPTAH